MCEVASMAKGKSAEPKARQRVEIEPPVRQKCGVCGSTELRVAYTVPFRESGFRQVTADCKKCGAICWWHEPLKT